MKSGKKEKKERKNRTTKSRMYKEAWREWKPQVLGNIWIIDEGKNIERVPQKNENASQKQALKQKSHQGENLNSLSCKIFETILKTYDTTVYTVWALILGTVVNVVP